MARKVGGRWQETVRPEQPQYGEGLEIVVTRKGVEARGFYDSMCGLDPVSLSWEDLDAIRARVREGVLSDRGE